MALHEIRTSPMIGRALGPSKRGGVPEDFGPVAVVLTLPSVMGSDGARPLLSEPPVRMIHAQPDFIIIGAMKCATTTLHEQLARQPGIVMSQPKEPNFFSDDANFAKGFAWYAAQFPKPRASCLLGESSTHYTKLPTYPRTVERMVRALPRVKLIYVMRHPIDRLISQYLHEWTVGRITVDLREAIDQHPELIDYGRYSMQLQPYLDAYGRDRVLPVFFGRLISQSQAELERIGRFLGCQSRLVWDKTMPPRNVGNQRLRKSVLRELLVQAPVLTTIRRRVIPKPWTEPLKGFWRVRKERPTLPTDLEERLQILFDDDLGELGEWLGIELHCGNFHEVTRARAHEWKIDCRAGSRRGQDQ
jgi:hypothetical protein